MNHYVYEITNLISDKKYIGKRSCKCKIEDDKYMGSGKYITRAIKKYGNKNFKKEILQVCENEQMAYEWEKVYIEQVKAYDNGKYYNIALGGRGFSSEQSKKLWKSEGRREKMLQVKKKLWENDEYRNKMKIVASETMKKTIKKLWENEEYRELQRKKCSMESKKRWENDEYRNTQIENAKRMWKDENKRNEIIKKLKIKYSTEESKRKRSYASKLNWERGDYRKNHINNLKDRWSNNEYRENMSMKMKDKFNDEEYVKRMKEVWEKHEKKVIMLNNKKVFNSCTEAGKFVGLENASTITLCCQGERLSAGKIGKDNAVWMYYDEYINSSDDFIELKIANSKESRHNSNSNLIDNSKNVICLNTGAIFNSLREASEFVGLKSGTSISNCCTGKKLSAGKINGEKAIWMYHDEYLKNM